MNDSKPQKSTSPLWAPDLVRRLLGKAFLKDVIAIGTGTAIAISIKVIAAPLLTRLFPPEAFGSFGVFLSVSAILAVVASGRYELAIVMAEDLAEAKRLVLLCTSFGVVSATVLFLLLIPTADSLLPLVGLESPVYAWLIPVFVLILSTGQALNNWLNWSKKYGRLGIHRTVRNTVTVATQAGSSMPLPGQLGLVAGRLAGEISFVVAGLTHFYRKGLCRSRPLPIRNRLTKYRSLLFKYRRLPIYTLPSAAINKTKARIPEILLLSFFDPRVAGLYALSVRVLERPLTFLRNAVKEVFFKRFSEIYQDNGDLETLLLKATGWMAIVVAGPFVLLAIFAPELVGFVFGSEWTRAGNFIRLLSPAIGISLVVRSTSLAMYVVDRHDFVLGWTTVSLILTTIAISLGGLLDDELLTIGLLSLVRCLMAITYWWYNWRFAKAASP